LAIIGTAPHQHSLVSTQLYGWALAFQENKPMSKDTLKLIASLIVQGKAKLIRRGDKVIAVSDL
jgi:hypothetical protein